MKIKALTVWQPWASFMAAGLKENETRSWGTKYRGPLAIHAAKSLRSTLGQVPIEVYELSIDKFGLSHEWPLGKILCVVNLVSCQQSNGVIRNPSSVELMLGNYAKGRFIWLTKMVQVFDEPIPVRGSQGLWDWDWNR